MRFIPTLDRSKKVTFLIAILMFLGIAPSQAQSVHELRSGVLVDAQEGLCFAMTPEGITALQITTGASLWRSQEASRPLALQGKRLVAQAAASDFGRLELEVLDTDTGNVLRSASVALPETVFAHTLDTVGSSFDIWEVSTPGSTDQIQLAWRFEHRLVQGIAPTEPPPPPSSHSGSFLFDPNTGASTQLADTLERSQPSLLVAENQRLPNVTGRQFHEQARQHILVSEKKADPSLWNTYQWTLYSHRGQRLGAIDSFVSFAKFIIHDSIILFETPPFKRMDNGQETTAGATLRAVALGNGVEQWSLALQETVYRGAFPP